MSQKREALNQVDSFLCDATQPAGARADVLIHTVAATGIDTRPQVQRLIEDADAGRVARQQQEEDDRPPLMCGDFVSQCIVDGKAYAAVVSPQGQSYLPCHAREVEGLHMGDRVLINTKSGRIAGRDGQVPPAGEVVSVEAFDVGDPRRVVVKHHDQTVMARVAARVHDEHGRLQPGQQVLYDPQTGFVHELVQSESSGDELVADVALLDKIDVEELAAAHPVMEQILFRIRNSLVASEWTTLMRPRIDASYLFVGPTGTGKTLHIKVLARRLADWLEELTGERVSPLIMVDAASFYSSLFGQTETNIKSFSRRMKKLGGRTLTTRDGRTIRQPWIVVLEECEALLRARGEHGGSAHLFDRPLALFLQELSSVGSAIDAPITFLATTNRGDLLDAAARRRVGVRQVVIGALSAGQAHAVLRRKLTPELPYRQGAGDAARDAVVQGVLAYLFGGDEAQQGIAEARCFDGTRRVVCRRHVVTGAMLEEAISSAKDECLWASAQQNQLLGLDVAAVIRGLEGQLRALATTLRPHNLAEHLPQWYQDEPLRVEAVKPLVGRGRLLSSVVN